MTLSLYYSTFSAPCRAVLLVASALNVELDLVTVNLMARDHLKPEFLKINPQHTVPTLVDGDFTLWESRTISRYLVNKYGGDSSLYPKDTQLRARIDQRLDFDLGTLYARFADYFYPQLFGGASPNEALYKKLEDALAFLNTFLEGATFVAGDQLTLADLSLVATVSTMEAAGINLAPYSNIQTWFELVKDTAPGYEDSNGKHVEVFRGIVEQSKAKKTEL